MHGPPTDWTWPHGAPRPTTFPARFAKPHELLRAQLTHPEPPDVDDDVPSFPTRSTPLRREDGGVVDPEDGQRPEIQHGAPAFLIGFRRADKQPAGAVRFHLHVPNIERGHLGHPQQPIACNRQQGGVAEAGERPAACKLAR